MHNWRGLTIDEDLGNGGCLTGVYNATHTSTNGAFKDINKPFDLRLFITRHSKTAYDGVKFI